MTFQKGQGGRPKGAKNKLAYQLFVDIFEHWTSLPSRKGPWLSQGLEALEIMSKEKPNEYVRAVLFVLPKDFVVQHEIESEEQIAERLERIRAAMLSAEKSEESDSVH